MKVPDRLVVASTNPGKVTEVRQLLSGLPVVLLTRDDVGGWPEIEETGSTYLENALIKARAVAAITGMAALADDSGIEVDALGGAPGVHSARYSGPGATDETNNQRLIGELARVPAVRRTARYRCVVVIVTPEGEELAALGSCEGTIGFKPRGTGGFGYDPWFLPAGQSRTMAELSAEEKDAISHRGRALRGLVVQLAES